MGWPVSVEPECSLSKGSEPGDRTSVLRVASGPRDASGSSETVTSGSRAAEESASRPGQ